MLFAVPHQFHLVRVWANDFVVMDVNLAISSDGADSAAFEHFLN